MKRINFFRCLYGYSFPVVLVLSLVIFGSGEKCAMAATVDIPNLKTPAMVTSLGQSPDAYCVSVLARRVKAPLKFKKLLMAKELGECKTLLLTVGASLKGFGSAGVNLDTEIERAAKILKVVKEQHIYLVVVHSGGFGRREAMSNKLLNVVAKEADFLLVYKEGNKDGYFTNLAKANRIPIKVVNKVLDIQGVLQKMFVPK